MQRAFQQLEPLSADRKKEKMMLTQNQQFIDGDQRLDTYWTKIEGTNKNSTVFTESELAPQRGLPMTGYGHRRPRQRHALSLPGKEMIERNYCGTKADVISDSNKSKFVAISHK